VTGSAEVTKIAKRETLETSIVCGKSVRHADLFMALDRKAKLWIKEVLPGALFRGQVNISLICGKNVKER
jgi:hypothetical protein